jgi:hypothetical protein
MPQISHKNNKIWELRTRANLCANFRDNKMRNWKSYEPELSGAAGRADFGDGWLAPGPVGVTIVALPYVTEFRHVHNVIETAPRREAACYRCCQASRD